MRRNYKARLVFPSIFHEYIFKKVDFKKDKKDLIDFCYLQKEIHSKGLIKSNYGGWHSPVYSINNDNLISEYLKKGLGKSVFTTLKKTVAAKIEYWIMINSPNTYNVAHTHPNCHLSGVFWIKAPKNSGDLKFMNSLAHVNYAENNSYIRQFRNDTNVFDCYKYIPTEGHMVTFSSSIMHEVQPNKSRYDRIAVSYNINLAGWDDNFDNDESSSYIKKK